MAGTLEFRTVSLAASQAAALQLAAATIALRVAVENVQQAVARVEERLMSCWRVPVRTTSVRSWPTTRC